MCARNEAIKASAFGVLAALGIGTFAVLALFGRSVSGNSDETAEGPSNTI